MIITALLLSDAFALIGAVFVLSYFFFKELRK